MSKSKTKIEELVEKSGLNAEAFFQIYGASKKMTFAKGEILVKQGEICNYLYYIEEGLTRIYYYDKEGRDVCLWFAAEKQIMIEVKSFFERTPSDYYIEALENTSVRVISLSKLNELLEKSHNLERFGRLLSLQFLYEANNRMMGQQFLTAKERYEDFITKQPEIYNRISLGHLASFLGITPQSLSRIRKEF
jgi:CRP-like cAMP-binding protein